MTALRLIAWNILHGGGPSRTAEIVLALRGLMPDIVVLCEFRAARGGAIRAALADAGLEHHAVAAGARPTGNAVLVASRWPLEVMPSPAGVGARYVHVRTCGIEVCGVHVPHAAMDVPLLEHPGTLDTGAKARFWQALLRLARGATDRRLVILGDMNTGRRGQDGRRFACEALLGNLLTLGFVDAWRAGHPESREQTWDSAAGSGRIDAAYLSPVLGDALDFCVYDHLVREAGWSDHSALVLGLRVPRPAATQATGGLFGAG